MKVVELLGAIGEDQKFDIRTKDWEHIDVKTAADYDADVLSVVAVEKGLIRIETNFTWYC